MTKHIQHPDKSPGKTICGATASHSWLNLALTLESAHEQVVVCPECQDGYLALSNAIEEGNDERD